MVNNRIIPPPTPSSPLKMLLSKEIHLFNDEIASLILDYDVVVDGVDLSFALP
jgi:hypothetical protein